MKLYFIGHACILLETAAGCRVIFDPFQPGAFGGRIRLRPWTGPVDAVVSSHDHLDHYHVDPSFGSPIVLRGPGQVHGVRLDCLEVPHGRPNGRDHGLVRVFRATAEGVCVVHMGDAGRVLTDQERDYLGRPDVLFVPIGGRFSLGPAEAAELVRAWSPRIVVPMHYADPLVDIVLEPLDAFIDMFDGVRFVDGVLEVSPSDLPSGPEVVVIRALQQPRHT